MIERTKNQCIRICSRMLASIQPIDSPLAERGAAGRGGHGWWNGGAEAGLLRGGGEWRALTSHRALTNAQEDTVVICRLQSLPATAPCAYACKWKVGKS
jgi:hypothetical protein